MASNAYEKVCQKRGNHEDEAKAAKDAVR